MKKFTDTEQVILTAVTRNNGAVPTRERSGSKVDPRAYGVAIASLIRKGMLKPRGPAREGDYAKDGQKLVLAKFDTDVETQAPAAKERKTREGTKQALLIEMLKRPNGATIDEIVTATGWQSHTARGAMAGTLKKKLGLTIESEKVETRGRVYRFGGDHHEDHSHHLRNATGHPGSCHPAVSLERHATRRRHVARAPRR